MSGFWGETPLLFEDLSRPPVVLCALGFGCGGTPKSAGEGVQLEAARGCVNTFVPGLTATNPEESERL